MKKDYLKIFVVLFICLICFLLGYGKGINDNIPNQNHDTITIIEKGDTIRVDVVDTFLIPIKVVKRDTIVQHLTALDSCESILSRYFSIKDYELKFGNDTIGDFDVDLTITENSLIKAQSTIVPIQRIKIIKETEFQPRALEIHGYIGTSIDLRTQQIGILVDLYDKWNIGLSGIRMNDNLGYTINVGAVF